MKNKFLSRIGQWYTPPYLRKLKTNIVHHASCIVNRASLTLALVAMVASVNLMAAETLCYTNDCPKNASNSTYANMYEVIINNLTWQAPGNQYEDGAWRIGGKNLSNTERSLYTKNTTAIEDKNISSIEITHGAASSVTIGGFAFDVYSTAVLAEAGGDGDIAHFTASSSDIVSKTKKFSRTSGNWTNRFYRFTYTLTTGKDNKYIALNSIKFYYEGGDDPDPTKPSLSVSPTTIDFGTVAVGGSVVAQNVTATLTNTDYAIATLSGTNADAFEITAGEELTETGTITVQPKATTLATEGTYSATLKVEADGVDDPKTVTISLVVVKPFTGNTWTLDKDDFTTGGYGSGTKTVDDIEISYTDVYQNSSAIQFKKTSGVIYNTTDFGKIEKIEITKTGNNNLNVYPGTSSNPIENAILGVASGNVTTYTFPTDENYGYFAIGKGSGASNVTPIKVFYYPIKSDITIDDNCENGSVFVTSPTILTQVASGTEITLGNTPDAGYTLGEYEVYKTGESATKVTITDGKFKMPAYGVTVSATFKTAKVLNSVEITTPASKTKYWIGEEFSTDGLVLTAHFADGDEVVTPTSITTPDMTTAGEKTITVSFTEGTTTKSDEYTITVKNTTNTKETAFTVAEAIDIIDKKLAPTTEVYVKGIVSKIDSYNSTYKSITYWISEDGTTTNQFELYSGKNVNSTGFNSKEDLSVGEHLIICGILTEFNGTKEMNANNYIVERVKVLQSIALSGEYPTEFSLNDPFSHEGQVVTASYNYDDDQNVTEFAEWSGYDMSQAGTQEVTVTYTENSISKTATYSITITKPCNSPITITKGAEVNGTFELSKVGYFCLDDEEGNKVSTVLTAEPAEHYHFASVTAEGCTIGAIEDNQCTISDIVADVTITANFVEDAKATATFVKGEEAATGDAPANIEQYVGEEITLPANTFAYAGHVFAGWSDGNNVYQANDKYTLTVNTEFTATWNELPIWATTYTSNVTVGTDKVRFSEEGTQYDAIKAGSSKSAGSADIKVPVGTCELHYHAAAWSSKSETLYVKNGSSPVAEHSILADAGLSNNSPFTLKNNPVDEYYMIKFEPALTEETTLTFSASSNRFILYGVNAIQPAAITIDPASKNFGEVKQGFNAEQVFSLTPNAFATGTITAEIDGEGFSASAVTDNKVTVTFAPTEIKDYNATLIIKHDGTQMCTATLSGKGITPTTPEIVVSDDEIDFGKEKQDATITPQAVTVTLNYLDAATASIDDNTYFSIDKTDLVAGENTITISATASSVGPKSAAITITGTGATTKTIAVKMDVTSKWAGDYNTDACITMSSSQNAKVVIDEEEYPAVKANDGANATITLPEGVTNLYFHAAAWNGEAVTLTAYKGTTTEESNKLGEFILVSDGGVKSSSPYTLQGENYDTDQYFHIDDLTDITEGQVITFVPNDNRYVIYGVHQEGGVTTVLQSIEIQGTATALNYEIGQTFVPTGLKVVGTFKKGDAEPTTRDLTNAEFDWSFDPAQFNEENESASVIVTATAKENTEVTANKTIENIVVIAPVVEITTTTTKVDFGTVAQNATVDNELVYVTFKNCTSASVALSGDDAEKFTIDAETVEAGETNWVIVGVADGTTATTGEYAAILTIHAEGAIADIVLPVTLFVEAPDVCDGTDDFDQDQSGTTVTTYGNRNTTNGWTAVNTAIATIGVAPNTEKFFTINGKTSAVGVITSPELEDGIASLKIRYANTFQETKGVSFRVDIKQGEDVVKTYTITKENAEVAQNTVYTETISDINVAGTYQIIITNLSPTSSSSNKDRLSIGRLCWTHYAGAPEYDETVRENVTEGTIGTMVYEHNITAIAGAVIYEPNYVDGNVLEFIEVSVDETVAGLPYIFVADGTNDGKVQINFGIKEPADGCEYKHRGLVGNIDDPDLYVSDPAYAIYQNQIRPANYTKVAVGRAYIADIQDLYDLVEKVPAAPRRRFSLGIERSMPTGFETIMMQKGMNKVIMNNQLYLIRDGKLFNAQGALVK